LDLSFNCGCHGSYNHPVPPQFTYHWPGTVYKQVLMTDYHSPWRFPPLKPYTDEVLTPQGASADEPALRPVSATRLIETPSTRGTQSALMERMFR
jgi:hypothetical protein